MGKGESPYDKEQSKANKLIQYLHNRHGQALHHPLRKAPNGSSFKRLPFNFCAASLQPFQNPVCTPEGTIFDVEVISQWLAKHGTNPVTGQPLKDKELIKLNFARNSDDGGVTDAKGDMVDPVTFKVFTDNTHIVAIRHGSEANVFAFETVERLNIKAKNWHDLTNEREFGRSDIITLQDPQNQKERQEGSVNIGALGRVGEKVLRAKEAVEKARREREAGSDVNRSKAVARTGTGNIAPKPSMLQEKKMAYNAAQYTTGKAAASFTSTGLTPETSGERALLTDEEYMLRPKRVKIKGYARIETNLGSLNIELQTETAPRAVWNFVQLAKKGYYNGVKFHRNIRNFMIQGGDPTGTGKGGSSIWGKNFNDEFDGPLTHDARGIMSMANKGKNTNSSQFFIIYRPSKHLDRKHTIFARVVGGLDVLQRLENAPVSSSDNRPLDDIVMENVVVFVDPFEEFQKQKREKDAVEEEKAEIKRQGGTEDDKTTWTGKRIRGDGTVVQSEQSGGVGKYLKAATDVGSGRGAVQEDNLEPEPPKKKVKVGGFGNFDSW
ncbi:Peptidyl-prolyl cis-trans isomerase-like [Lachnellula subtilissima]|uniref:Peptidyl-prolyl cis-trans isomerase-like 2 n=1 Tax=Lachnellula subtilissima TaxID=602034 RepID=A0A8H8UBP7_9HELO|nr:Peptidyl-prolyl cis-trans isomerase-like [Lachnellula subtilissima]